MMNITPDSIFQVATGFMASKHLFVANEIGLFEQLAEGPTTLDELAQRIDTPRRTILASGKRIASTGQEEAEHVLSCSYPERFIGSVEVGITSDRIS